MGDGDNDDVLEDDVRAEAPTPAVDAAGRDAAGRFSVGNQAARKGPEPWAMEAWGKGERRWRADLVRRLEQAGRGSRRWCQQLASEALEARRFLRALTHLDLREQVRLREQQVAARERLGQIVGLADVEPSRTSRGGWHGPRDPGWDPLA